MFDICPEAAGKSALADSDLSPYPGGQRIALFEGSRGGGAAPGARSSSAVRSRSMAERYGASPGDVRRQFATSRVRGMGRPKHGLRIRPATAYDNTLSRTADPGRV